MGKVLNRKGLRLHWKETTRKSDYMGKKLHGEVIRRGKSDIGEGTERGGDDMGEETTREGNNTENGDCTEREQHGRLHGEKTT